MTSAGSQRRLAALVGVSHQRIGRWLREGQPGGVKTIPPEFTQAIETAFELHAEVSRDQAAADHLPFNPDLPVFMSRPDMRKIDRKTGQPMKGERAIVSEAQYMTPELRNRVIVSQQKSRQFSYVSVASIIDLYKYLKIDPDNPIEDGEDRIQTVGMLNAFMFREKYLGPTNAAAKLFTKKENIMPGTGAGLMLRSLNGKLSEKHEPHSVPGMVGTELLFKTLPDQFDNFEKSQAQMARRAAAPKRVRKPAPKSTLRNRR